MNLFIKEDFISHAGLPLTWKVECDALDENDYEALEMSKVFHVAVYRLKKH